MTIDSDDDFEFLETPDGPVVVTDPDMGELAETEYSIVDASGTTTGPNRYTVYVPYDKSTLSLGKASDKWIKDDGITARTEKHAHIHVLNPQTMVLLGGCTNEGWVGPNGSDNPGSNEGFMAVTEGKAWHESRGHQYLMSKDGDAVLRSAASGKRVVVQADKGEVDVLAKKKVYAVAPTVSIMAPASFAPSTTFNYASTWTPELPVTTAGKMTKNAVTVVGLLTGAHDLGKKVPKIWKSYKKGKKELETSITDTAKWLLDLTKWGMTANKMLGLWSTEPLPGQVKIGADADVGVLAGSDVSVWGGSGFSAGGGIWTSVSGGVATSVKGVLWASLGGTWTSVKAYRKLDLGCEYGKTAIKAKSDVDLMSEEGDAKVGAKGLAQVLADDKAFVHGKTKAVLTAGDGSGYGVVAQAQRMLIGKVDKAKEVGAKGNEAALIVIRDDSFRVVHKQSRIQIEGNEALVRAKGIKLSAESGSNVTVNGAKILLN
jgi:hypothetical protein